MIIVIADDFTGAAELAGIALKFGLSAEVLTTAGINPEADINIIDTNTRSKSSAEAKKTVSRILQSLDRYKYEFLFKKIDSVFRGHVYEEVSVLLEKFQDKSVLLVPANPSRGRTISNGAYFIDGHRLHETVFAGDPESPIHNSDIFSLLKVNKNDGVSAENGVRILKPGAEIPASNSKMYVGEAGNSDDIITWANKLNQGIIPAGAADFFEAILSFKGYPRNEIPDPDYKSLFICGSSLSRVVNLEEELFSRNPKVVEVSEDQIYMDGRNGVIESIARKVIDQYRTTNNVILFVNASKTQSDIPTSHIPGCLAAVTSLILNELEVRELFIEGGTTSSEIVRKVGWDHFKPVLQLGHGIVRMHVVNSPTNFITVKPGSYKWPRNLWNDDLMNHKQNQ